MDLLDRGPGPGVKGPLGSSRLVPGCVLLDPGHSLEAVECANTLRSRTLEGAAGPKEGRPTSEPTGFSQVAPTGSRDLHPKLPTNIPQICLPGLSHALKLSWLEVDFGDQSAMWSVWAVVGTEWRSRKESRPGPESRSLWVAGNPVGLQEAATAIPGRRSVSGSGGRDRIVVAREEE